MFDDTDEVATLPGFDRVADIRRQLAMLDVPPWRSDQPQRAWMACQDEVPCVWCGRGAHTLVGHVHVRPDGEADIDATAAHPACEAAHFSHGSRVAQQLVDILQARPSALDVWAELDARGPFGTAARQLGADLVASDGLFFLPSQAGHRLLDEPVPCKRCTLPAYAAVHLAGLDVPGPQHWSCVEARVYQGLEVTTLADELYPGSVPVDGRW